jgi:hypothetical protein
MDPSPTDEFEVYLQQRRRRRRLVLVGLAVAFVGIVAVPYALMKAGLITQGRFEVFCFLDFFVAVGFVRALVVRVTDSAVGF